MARQASRFVNGDPVRVPPSQSASLYTMIPMPSPESLIKSKERVADHGEVFTPSWMVEAMLDLVKNESERIDSRFLEPACGSGNFLIPVLRRKLAAVELKYKSEFEKRQHALLAVMCVYGIEIQEDNIVECRANLLEVLAECYNLAESDDLYRAASYALSVNIVHGDAMKLLTDDGRPLTFAEWGYLGKGKFQRRDFLLETLEKRANYGKPVESSLFSDAESHDPFLPIRDYPPITMRELAACLAETPEET